MYTRFHMRTRKAAIVLLTAAVFIITGCGVGVANSNWPGLSASDDIAYVAYGPTVIAVDVVNEEQIWSFPEEPQTGQQFYAAPSVVENHVVIGDYGQSGGFFSPGVTVSVYGLREEEGDDVPVVEWTSNELLKDRVIAPPLQVGDQVFIGTADNHLYALDAANNGALLWEFETDHSIWGQPTYEDGVVYVSSLDKSLYALEADSGDLLWESTTGGSISDRAQLNSDLVYISSFDNKVHAIDKSNGDVRWSAESEAAVWGAPAFGDGRVFFSDLNGNVRAVDGESGNEIWQISLDSYQVAAPLLKDGVLYLATAGLLNVEPAVRQGEIIALDADSGDEIWSETQEAPIYTTPVLIGDSIVVALVENQSLAIVVRDAASGDELWTFQPSPRES